ncbi:hypothetical protein J7426_16650 [Tropicibacter sp. R16_0]|uniref:hypothetical protein n=1 Tax=Tropicibacter sp. R16_0 TaxID=2821102 RepID=UPI001ADA8BA3|nr:hypothetical protein [Tropicibacter sp. R16_0]MBO9451907.1 hypothetical protein [Tropicibacter sp. R16_0]
MRYLIPLLFIAAPALADAPLIEKATARASGDTWRFDVTIRHPDTGWDDYADGWQVLDMDGNELGMRVLHHPHVDEQPFTRSLSGVKIPAGTKQVQIRARDSVGGWAKETTIIDLP